MSRKVKPEIVLTDYTPNEEECKYVIFRVIYQAVADYMNLSDPKTEEEIFNWESARDFLFNEEYFLLWGTQEVKSVDLMDLVDIDPEWLRDKVNQKAHPVFHADGVITPKRIK